MKFWDSSALVPLLVAEEATTAVTKLYRREPGALVWWASEAECASGIARLTRSGDLSPSAANASCKRLSALARSWHRIEPAEIVRETAVRFLRVHDLRAVDALQLAAAFVASEGLPTTPDMVCLDDRLAGAAEREGFHAIAGAEILG